jgi:phosphoribosylformylglycinamidine cyclo-ligase
MFPIPPLFKLIQGQSGTSWQEMYKVFNMGHRLEIYCREELAENVISISSEYNVNASVVGYCEASEKKKLTIHTGQGKFLYE